MDVRDEEAAATMATERVAVVQATVVRLDISNSNPERAGQVTSNRVCRRIPTCTWDSVHQM